MLRHIVILFTFMMSNYLAAETINLPDRAKYAADNKRVHIIYFSASYCSYCAQLEKEVIEPLKKSTDYESKVLITQLAIDGGDLIVDFNQKITDADDLSSALKARVTPTLLFINSKGEEIVNRIVGFQNVEFYWYYLNQAIEEARHSLGYNI